MLRSTPTQSFKLSRKKHTKRPVVNKWINAMYGSMKHNVNNVNNVNNVPHKCLSDCV